MSEENAQEPASQQQGHTGQQEGQPANKEARYRIRAKEAEARAETLGKQLHAARSGLLENALKTDSRLNPDAVADVIADMDEERFNTLFASDTPDTDGYRPNEQRLKDFVTDLLEHKPYLKRADSRPKIIVPGGEKNLDGRAFDAKTSWGNAFK